MNDCVRGTIWDGYALLLGQVSAETPHLHWVAVPGVIDDEAEGRLGAQDNVAPPGVRPWCFHHISGCMRRPFTEPKCRGKAHL